MVVVVVAVVELVVAGVAMVVDNLSFSSSNYWPVLCMHFIFVVPLMIGILHQEIAEQIRAKQSKATSK